MKTTELAFPYRNVGAGVSTVKSIVGGIGVGVTSIMALTGLVTSGIASFSFVAPVIFAGVFGYVLSGGIRTDRLSRLADRYVQIIGKRQYIEVKALSLSNFENFSSSVISRRGILT